MKISKSPETTTDISSDKAEAPEFNAILLPGTKEYETALEKIYGKRPEPVLDCLGRLRKNGVTSEENDVAAKTKDPDFATSVKQRHVLLFEDTLLAFPELYLRVKLIGPPADLKGFSSLFVRADCEAADDFADADLVVFTGGPDVDPAYYGEEQHHQYYGDVQRDYADVAAYMTCLEEGIPMVGVCRGAQFGAVMNGARLWQHVDGHHGDHKMYDVKQNIMLDRVSSVHHQMVRPCKGMEVLGVSRESTKRWSNNTECHEGQTTDIEAFFFRDTCFFGVQGHPEYRGYAAFSQWFLERICEFVITNEDIEWRNNRRRLREEFIMERDLACDTTIRPTLTVIKGDK